MDGQVCSAQPECCRALCVYLACGRFRFPRVRRDQGHIVPSWARCQLVGSPCDVESMRSRGTATRSGGWRRTAAPFQGDSHDIQIGLVSSRIGTIWSYVRFFFSFFFFLRRVRAFDGLEISSKTELLFCRGCFLKRALEMRVCVGN